APGDGHGAALDGLLSAAPGRAHLHGRDRGGLRLLRRPFQADRGRGRALLPDADPGGTGELTLAQTRKWSACQCRIRCFISARRSMYFSSTSRTRLAISSSPAKRRETSWSRLSSEIRAFSSAGRIRSRRTLISTRITRSCSVVAKLRMKKKKPK